MKEKIIIDNIYKSFGEKSVLKGVSLTIYEGETFTIIGGSGQGKSVLMKHIVGLLKPDSGRVFVDEYEISSMKKDELIRIIKKFGYVFQGAALFDSMTIYENIEFGLKRFYDYSEEERKEIIKEALEDVGLYGVEELYPAQLSGGMRKRAGLARAIALKPEILLYDEPTTGLDPVLSDSIIKLIVEVSQKFGVTSVIITHDMKCAMVASTRIAMLNDGKIIGPFTPEEIRTTENPYVKQFISGSSEGPLKYL